MIDSQNEKGFYIHYPFSQNSQFYDLPMIEKTLETWKYINFLVLSTESYGDYSNRLYKDLDV
jgi:trehalose-6-phosphate synthase